MYPVVDSTTLKYPTPRMVPTYLPTYLKLHHHWAAVLFHGWAKASACRLQVSLSCAILCQIVSLQYLSRSSLRRLAGLPCRPFLSYALQVATRDVHGSSAVGVPCPGPFNCFYIDDYVYDLRPLSLTQMLLLLYVYVEHDSFHFTLCGRKFVLFEFG